MVCRFLILAMGIPVILLAQQDLWELFPVETDVKKNSNSNKADKLIFTGPRACKYFIKDGAPIWKIYKPQKGALVVLFFWGEGVSSDLQLRLLTKEDELWYKMRDLVGPSLNTMTDDLGYRMFAYRSDGKPLMVKAYGNGCFLRVFQIGGGVNPVRLGGKLRKQVTEALKLLWDDDWHIRRRGLKALVKLARKEVVVMRYLQQLLKKTYIPWRRILLTRIMWRVEGTEDEKMVIGGLSDLRIRYERLLVWALRRVRDEEKGDAAQKVIEWMAPFDVNRTFSILDHRFPEARLAALRGLARTNADLKAALKLYNDRYIPIRLETIKIFSRYPTNKKALDALHEMAEDDPDKRVRLAAEDALQFFKESDNGR